MNNEFNYERAKEGETFDFIDPKYKIVEVYSLDGPHKDYPIVVRFRDSGGYEGLSQYGYDAFQMTPKPKKFKYRALIKGYCITDWLYSNNMEAIEIHQDKFIRLLTEYPIEVPE